MPDLLSLSQRDVSAKTVKFGSYTFDVAAEKRVNVRYWAPGETTVLDQNVPVGKAWTVTVSIEIQEVNE